MKSGVNVKTAYMLSEGENIYFEHLSSVSKLFSKHPELSLEGVKTFLGQYGLMREGLTYRQECY